MNEDDTAITALLVLFFRSYLDYILDRGGRL